MGLAIEELEEGVTFGVKVTPGSSRTGILGVYGSDLKISVAAAAEGGKANKELISYLARILGLSRSSVNIVSGPHQAHKQISLTGLSAEQLRGQLERYLK